MTTPTCVICGDPGEPRSCCPSKPVLCTDHDAEHRAKVHGTEPKRSVDDALAEALAAEGIEED